VCVKAPKETKSTPHFAYSKILSSVIPPEDSVSNLLFIALTAFFVSENEKLSSKIRLTPPSINTSFTSFKFLVSTIISRLSFSSSRYCFVLSLSYHKGHIYDCIHHQFLLPIFEFFYSRV
jgi:hypothetical protein